MPMHRATPSRHALLSMALALALLVAPSASAQMAILDPAAQSVMSSRDFEKLLGAIGFDSNQRATAGAIFDDMQRELMAARDELASAPATGPASGTDARAAADHEARTRRAYQRMAAAEQTFFDGLSAIAHPAQQSAVNRERLGAACRLVRRTLGAREGSSGAIRVDLVAAVADANLSDAVRARALEALAGYQAQIAEALRQALDTGLAVPAKAARLRETQADSEGAGAESVVPIALGGDPATRQASRAFDAAVDRLTHLHLQGIAALDGPLDGPAVDAIAMGAARRIWPGASRDPRSPRAAFAQLLREIESGSRAAEQRAALDAARERWLNAWWSATRKACDAEGGLRRLGMLAPPTDESKALRRAMREATDQRDEANRAAWKALAALDPEQADFYRPLMAPPEQNQGFAMMGGSEPVPPRPVATASNGESAAPAVQTFNSAVMIVSSSSAGDADEGEAFALPLVFEGTANGPIAIQMGPDGVATFMTDTLGDGLMDGETLSLGLPGSSLELSFSGARFPAPIRRETALEYARLLAGTALAPALFDQLYADYSEQFRRLDDSLGAAARESLRGHPPGMSFRVSKGGGVEEPDENTPRSLEDLRAGMSKLDEYMTQLASIDDAFIANLSASTAPPHASNAAPANRERVAAEGHARVVMLQEERARERLNTLRYPTSPMVFHSGGSTPQGADLAAVVRTARLQDADLLAADRVLSEWSPAAVAAREQARGVLRTESLAMLEAERTMLRRMEELRGQMDAPGEGLRVERVSDGMDGMRAQQSAMERISAARARVLELDFGTQNRLEEAFSPAGAEALLAAWCRAMVPQAFLDQRNADAMLQRALALTDLPPEERRQIEALHTTHATEHAALTEKIGRIAAKQALAAPGGGFAFDGPPDAGASERARDRRRLNDLRFDRAELNERTLRRLRTILDPALADAIALPRSGQAAVASTP